MDRVRMTRGVMMGLAAMVIAAQAIPHASGQAAGQPGEKPETPAAEAEGASAETPDDAALLEQLMAEGGNLYRAECAVCHGQQGQGGAGPGLGGSRFLESEVLTINQIILGGDYMPGFSHLGDAGVAAVTTYIRNSFGNSFGITTEADVADR